MEKKPGRSLKKIQSPKIWNGLQSKEINSFANMPIASTYLYWTNSDLTMNTFTLFLIIKLFTWRRNAGGIDWVHGRTCAAASRSAINYHLHATSPPRLNPEWENVVKLTLEGSLAKDIAPLEFIKCASNQRGVWILESTDRFGGVSRRLSTWNGLFLGSTLHRFFPVLL